MLSSHSNNTNDIVGGGKVGFGGSHLGYKNAIPSKINGGQFEQPVSVQSSGVPVKKNNNFMQQL